METRCKTLQVHFHFCQSSACNADSAFEANCNIAARARQGRSPGLTLTCGAANGEAARTAGAEVSRTLSQTQTVRATVAVAAAAAAGTQLVVDPTRPFWMPESPEKRGDTQGDTLPYTLAQPGDQNGSISDQNSDLGEGRQGRVKGDAHPVAGRASEALCFAGEPTPRTLAIVSICSLTFAPNGPDDHTTTTRTPCQLAKMSYNSGPMKVNPCTEAVSSAVAFQYSAEKIDLLLNNCQSRFTLKKIEMSQFFEAVIMLNDAELCCRIIGTFLDATLFSLGLTLTTSLFRSPGHQRSLSSRDDQHDHQQSQD